MITINYPQWFCHIAPVYMGELSMKITSYPPLVPHLNSDCWVIVLSQLRILVGFGRRVVQERRKVAESLLSVLDAISGSNYNSRLKRHRIAKY
jgi:hypothetical protein